VALHHVGVHNPFVDFVDRGDELARLRRSEADGGLVVVWGRRRVGKTRLLVEWARAAGGLYWVADESAPALSRRYLADALSAALPGFGDVRYDDWPSLLGRLARDAKSAGFRGPLVLDEVPYLLASSPELASALQRFIDHDARSAGLLVALAGSAQHMMQGLTLEPTAPLWGRAREIIKLRPIPAGHIGSAFQLAHAGDAVRAWALWGGIPRYWELAASFSSSRDAADALVLDPMGPLHDEPARLLLEELPSATSLRPLLDAIGAGAHRVSEIAGRIGQPATSLARPLSRLLELDMVVRETPFGEPERSTKRALYKLADPFLRLWFGVVAPRRSQLLMATRKGRLQLLDARLPYLVASAWEDLCREAVPKLGTALGPVSWGPAQRFWSGAGPEWDLVAAGDDGSVLIGEAKWTEREPTMADVDRTVAALRAKGLPSNQPHETKLVVAVFFPTLPKGARRKHADVHLVDAKQVLRALR
jgi:AAA+ ATPase superfamily predicted ATPase